MFDDEVTIPIDIEFTDLDASDEKTFQDITNRFRQQAQEINAILEQVKTTAQMCAEGIELTGRKPQEITKGLKKAKAELEDLQNEMQWLQNEIESRKNTGERGTVDNTFYNFQGMSDEALTKRAEELSAAIDRQVSEYNRLAAAAQDTATTADAAMSKMTIQQRTEFRRLGKEVNEAIAKLAQMKQAAADMEGMEFFDAKTGKDITEEKTAEQNRQIQEQQKLVDELMARYHEFEMQAVGATDAAKSSTESLKESTKEAGKAIKEASKASEESEKKSSKKKNDHFGGGIMGRESYYVLRQIRLLQSELDRLNKNAHAVANTFVKSMSRMGRAVATLALGFTNLHRATKKADSAHKSFGKNLSKNFFTVLRYVVGIRSLFAITKKLRGALAEGMQNLAQYSDYTNQQMSSLVTSLLYMKNSIATAAQPFLNVLAPALEFVAQKVNDLSFSIAQLVASLTGQSFVYKAKRAQVDYAKSLDKSSKAAKSLAKELGEYDKLEVIKKNKDDDDGMPDPSEMFETISPISDYIQDLGNKIRSIASQFFAPIKKAWSTQGKAVMDAWKKALSEVGGLVSSIGRDFLKMWNEDATVKMWDNIFAAVGNVGTVIGNIAHNLKEAWDENGRGLLIWENLRDIVAIFAEKFKELTDYMVQWSSELDFTNLLDSINVLLEALKPVAEALGGIFNDIIENVFLEYIRYLVEEGVPMLNEAIAKIAGAVDWDTLRTNLQPLEEAVANLMKAAFEGLSGALETVGLAVADFVNSDEFAEFLETITGFINDIADNDIIEKVFTALGLAILDLAKDVADFVNSQEFKDFMDWLITALSEMSAQELADVITGVAKALLAFSAVFTGLKWISNFATFATTLASFLSGPIGAIGMILGGAIAAVASFVDMFKNGWNIIGEIIKDVGIALVAIGAIILGAPALIAAAVAAIVAALTFIILWVKDHWENAKRFGAAVKAGFGRWWAATSAWIVDAWNKFKQKIHDTVQWFKNGLSNLGKLIKLGLDSIVSTFKKVKDTVVSVFQALWNKIKSIINSILGGIEKMVNGAIKGINGLIGLLNNFKLDVPDWMTTGIEMLAGVHVESIGFNLNKLNTISIPKLAKGAVIPPNKEFLATLGDQTSGVNIETPLETMVEAFKTALAEEGSNQAPIMLQLDGKTVARVVWDETEKKYKQTGRYIPQMA